MKLAVVFAIGIAIGAVASSTFWWTLRNQERDLNIYESRAQSLIDLSTIILSYRTRGEGLSFQQFVNCITRTAYDDANADSERIVGNYDLAQDWKERVLERFDFGLGIAKEQLLLDEKNSCPMENYHSSK